MLCVCVCVFVCVCLCVCVLCVYCISGSLGIVVALENGERVTWKVKVFQLVADLPAKAQLLNQVQYNGEYGCSVRSMYTLHCGNVVLFVGIFFTEMFASRREN